MSGAAADARGLCDRNKMYSSKIKQWGMFKNNGDTEKAPSIGGEGMPKRKRYNVKAAEKVFYALLDHAIPTNPASVRPPPEVIYSSTRSWCLIRSMTTFLRRSIGADTDPINFSALSIKPA
jgi:hypothetical protein